MLNTNITYLKRAILGDRQAGDEEIYFMRITTFISACFSLVLCGFHIVMGLKFQPVVIASGSSLVLFGLYYMVRHTRFHTLAKILLTVLGLLFLDFTWYAKYFSTGPLLFFILIFGALVIWVWRGRNLVIMLSYYFINIVVLFLIEYNLPDYTLEYKDFQARTVDIYISFFLYSFLLIFLLSVVKKEFLSQRDKAQESERLKSAFLANMSHEIRTPLNAIAGFSELLSEDLSDEEKKTFATHIQNSSQNLLTFFNEIIDLSKIEIGGYMVRPIDFNLSELFEELYESYKIELNRKKDGDVSFVLDLPEKDIYFHCDPMRIRQILSNLIVNAIKFTTKGTITMGCKWEQTEMLFFVKDTGVGIPEKHQEKIFERFVNYNYSGLNNEGTGIGLAIVKRIVLLLNGKVWLESELNKGTTFYVSLPRTKPQKNISDKKAGRKQTS